MVTRSTLGTSVSTSVVTAAATTAIVAVVIVTAIAAIAITAVAASTSAIAIAIIGRFNRVGHKASLGVVISKVYLVRSTCVNMAWQVTSVITYEHSVNSH